MAQNLSKVIVPFVGIVALLCFTVSCTDKSGDSSSTTVNLRKVNTVSTCDVGEYDGVIMPHRTVNVSPRAEGVLQKMFFAEGAEVRKGQSLFQIDPTVYQALVNKAAAAVAKAKANLRKAESDLARIRPLFEANAVSQLDLDNAENMYENANAELQTAKAELELARLNLDNTIVRAPISGVISRSNVDVGSYVSPGSGELSSVINVDTVNVEFSLSAREYQRSRLTGVCFDAHCTNPDHETDYFVTVTNTDGSVHPQPGKVDFAAHRADAENGTIFIRAVVPNMPHVLMPGTHTSVKVVCSRRHSRIAIPRTAIVEDNSKSYVYIPDSDGRLVMKPVSIGTAMGDSVLVTSGLNVGDYVATDNVDAVKSGKKYNTVKH